MTSSSAARRRRAPGCTSFSAEGRSGNNFLAATQTSARDEGRVNAFLPVISAAGDHQLQAGVDADRLSYDGDFNRSGYEIIGLNNAILSSTTYRDPDCFTSPTWSRPRICWTPGGSRGGSR